MTSGELCPQYPLENVSKCSNLIFGVCSSNILYIIQINICKIKRLLGAISMHQSNPFLGISFSYINYFISLNIDTLPLKLANIWHFDLILEHLLHLDQKCVTMETRNLKHDKNRSFPLIIGLCNMIQVFQKFKSYCNFFIFDT